MKETERFGYIVMLLILLYLSSFFIADMFYYESSDIAIIPIKGVIMGDDYSIWGEEVISSRQIIKWIDDADSNYAAKAIIFEINSPGGSALAGKEIVDRIDKLNKTNVAVIREIGASSGYLIASATDHVIADELSITGSIGATASYLGYSGLLDRFNISYERLVSAKYKDMGSPYKKMTEDERELFMDQLQLAHAYFTLKVAENRNMPIEDVNKLADGSIKLGIQAKKDGLIDELGNIDTAKEYIQNKLGIDEVTTYEYEIERSFFDSLSLKAEQFAFYAGKGFGNSFVSHSSYPKIQ